MLTDEQITEEIRRAMVAETDRIDPRPGLLGRIHHELTRATAPELVPPGPTLPPRRRRPRRRMLAGAAASCGVVGAAAVAVAIVAIGGGSADSAWDQHVLRAAEIALPKPAPNTIVHVSVTQTMTPNARGNSALLVPTLDAEGWFQQGTPYRSLTREQVPGQTPTWQTSSRLYDPATKRVYVDPKFPTHPRFTLTKTGPDGIVTLRIATSNGPVRETVTAAQARGLRAGDDGIQWVAGLNASHKFFLGAGVVPRAQASNVSSAGPPPSTSLTFPAQLHRLLQSGNARVVGRTTVDSRAAIRIAISGVSGYHRMTYYVDPATYRPIELDDYGSSSTDLTRIVFHTYQQLPTKGNARLLALPTSAGTSVDHNPVGFYQHIPPLLLW